ncbi:hypothetical protein ACLKA7_002209 [Drosophila subpalustris]
MIATLYFINDFYRQIITPPLTSVGRKFVNFYKIIMENDAGENVDLYVPRKCSASNRIIHAKDHASVQLSIVVVDPETGRQTDGTKTYAICGEIRRMGESDDCIVRLAKKDGLITKNF